jgi:hypothetical protein
MFLGFSWCNLGVISTYSDYFCTWFNSCHQRSLAEAFLESVTTSWETTGWICGSDEIAHRGFVCCERYRGSPVNQSEI